MWKRFVIILLLFALSSSLLSPLYGAAVTLSEAEVAEIREILRDTKKKAALLRQSLEAQQTESLELLSRLRTVENRLREVEKKLQSSQESLELSQADLRKSLLDLSEARQSLETLKADYLALSRSSTKLRKERDVWRAIALTSVAVIGGMALYHCLTK